VRRVVARHAAAPPIQGIRKVCSGDQQRRARRCRIKARLADLGSIPTPMSSADYAMLIVAETEKWSAMIKAANIKLE
jgi:hypothetical protein